MPSLTKFPEIQAANDDLMRALDIIDPLNPKIAAKQYLLKNLARMHGEFLQARQQARTNRSQMFQQRGISLDSNLWPDYDLDLQLQRMAANGMLKRCPLPQSYVTDWRAAISAPRSVSYETVPSRLPRKTRSPIDGPFVIHAVRKQRVICFLRVNASNP